MTKPLHNEELWFLLSRTSSGILNGGFYGNLQWLGILGGLATIIFSVLSVLRKKKKRFKKAKLNRLENTIYWISFSLMILAIILVMISFASPSLAFADVHLWTYLTQLFQGFCMFLNNPKHWWRLLLLIIPAVFLQKLCINLLGGNKWNYQGTDVQSGSHFTMMGMKIPRFLSGNMYVRLILGLLSIGALWITKKK